MSISPTISSSSPTPGASSVREPFSPTSLAYLTALNYVLANGEKVGPRGRQTLEVEDYHFTVDNPDSRPIVTNSEERNKVIAEYTAKEFELYNSGSNQALDFSKASTFWKNIANPDGTINSSYGHLLWKKKSCGDPKWFCHKIAGPDCDWMTPWDWAKGSLLRDHETRQAYLRFSLPSHQWFGNKDQVCTMHGLFLIRNNRLSLSVVMRSTDLVKGLVYDMPFFVNLMDRMVTELKDESAQFKDLEIGQYRHLSHSLHIYESDLPKVKAMLALYRK